MGISAQEKSGGNQKLVEFFEVATCDGPFDK